MKFNKSFFFLFVPFLFTVDASAQLWSGILKPTSGSSACSYGQITSAGQCAIDWTQVGIPGGIPTNWSQSGATITPSGGDDTSTIQAALNSCAGTSLPGKYVLLAGSNSSPATFKINGNIQVKSYCKLVGGGPLATIVSCFGTAGSCVHEGVVADGPYKNGTGTIVGGNAAGSTSLTISSTSQDGRSMALGLSVGGYLVISELNDPVYVSGASPQNPGGCTYCDTLWGGTRLREQTVEIESVSGSGPYTVTISPALYTNYGVASGTAPAYATPMGVENGGVADCKYCGIESLQIYANGTGLAGGMSSIDMTECAYCWVKNVTVNYTDGDWLDTAWCYRCEIRDSYFFNSFGHGAGGTDNDVNIRSESSGVLMENNILERGHSTIIVDWGASGNVIAYNYSTGSTDAVGVGANQYDIAEHGAYPQFNLFEGNVGPNWQPDSWHGNEGYNTVFRNWWMGTTLVAPYTAQPITSGTCSGGTCTINWKSGASQFYAGTYIILWGTNQAGCGNGSSIVASTYVWRLTGATGQLSSTFAAGSCTSWTGGYAATNDIQSNPTPITHLPLDFTTNDYNTYQAMWGMTIPAFSVGNNLIANVIGSQQQVATVGAGSMFNNGAECTACIQAPTARSYLGIGSKGGAGYATTFGYDTSGDSNGSSWTTFAGGPSGSNGYWNTQGFATTCYSSNYDSASASTIVNINCTPSTSLPASFYKSGRPSWWTTGVPWPPIGPDVVGGADSIAGNHANYNPAEVCYISLPRDATGAKQFDARKCYNSISPASPIDLTAGAAPKS
jgi:hypothetical protein